MTAPGATATSEWSPATVNFQETAMLIYTAEMRREAAFRVGEDIHRLRVRS